MDNANRLGDCLYRDRLDAGRHLAEHLTAHRGAKTLVLGIPRGGVVIAEAIARRLDAELDVVVARKLGAPGHEELAIGAVTADGARWLNDEILAAVPIDPEYLEDVTRREQAEAERRERRFRGDRPPPVVAGRVVIVADDGLATGATARAALGSLRRQRAGRLILAVPVGALDSCRALERHADEVVCPHRLPNLVAISLYYEEFGQVEDREVEAILSRGQPSPPGSEGVVPEGSHRRTA